jgi:hypothetical protein
MKTPDDFEKLVGRAFQFLEENGYVRCPIATDGTDPRDVEWRVRYYRAQRVVDVRMAIGLGLRVDVRTMTNPTDAGCTATDFSATTNIETVASDVRLPAALRVRGKNTLYEAYNNHIFTYQKVLQTRVPEALSYLAARLDSVLNESDAKR